MRRVALLISVLALALPAGVLAAHASAGSLSVVDARGVIKIQGRGALLGRLDSGTLQIVDLSPADPWSPRVNGVPRGRVVGIRGRDVSFYVPGGRYRLVVRGEGIHISARGQGIATIAAEPDVTGAAGTYAVDDDEPAPLPDVVTRVAYGLDVSLLPVRLPGS
ncbi:MAG: hypothetical protein OEV72_02480 [Thermoleophilia bacterium]|nr:hypothetical protein [Thermoleophilia bacterium]MDH5333358.1 hypothetical protein [Thermoleophilia bacterium]